MEQIKIKSLLLAGVITFMSGVLAACTQEVGYAGQDDNSEKYLTFRVDDGDSFAGTRGSHTTTSSLTTGFGVSASVYPSTGSYTNYPNGNYFYKIMARPNTATTYFWPATDNKISFYAYFPYDNASFTIQSLQTANGSPTYAYSVPENISSQLDVMTTQRTDMSCATAVPVSLSFEHRCSDIRFFAYNQSYSDMTIKSISIYGVKYSGTWRSGTTWTLTGSVNSSTSHPFTLTANTVVSSKATVDITSATNHFIMLPQTVAAGTDFFVIKTIEGGDEQTYTYTLPSSQTWEMGKSYIYTLTLGNGTLTVASVDVVNWQPNTTIYPSVITWTADVNDAVDLGLPSGVLWAKGNIIPDGNGGYQIGEESDWGAYVSWGNVTPHFSSNGTTFDDYEWGTSNDGIYASTPGASISNSQQIGLYDAAYSPNSGYDAARELLGGMWRMPTCGDFKELNENCTHEYATINGVYGMKFTSNITGYTDKYVFFPAAGFGDYNYQNTGRGSYGAYWSSTLNPYNNSYGVLFLYYGYNFFPNAFDQRYFGCSIRAVQ